MQWVETASFPYGLVIEWFWTKPRSMKPKSKPLKMVKYSDARWVDVLLAIALGRAGTYGEWKPASDTGVARARAKSFKNKLGGQFHKFRGGTTLQYTYYISEGAMKLGLMVMLAVLAGPGNGIMQATTASVFGLASAVLTLVACPYNNFAQNVNEVRGAFLKPMIFILAAGAATSPPELRGLWGTGMVMTQGQTSVQFHTNPGSAYLSLPTEQLAVLR